MKVGIWYSTICRYLFEFGGIVLSFIFLPIFWSLIVFEVFVAWQIVSWFFIKALLKFQQDQLEIWKKRALFSLVPMARTSTTERLDQLKQTDTILNMKYELSIVVGTIEADNLEEAKEKALSDLEFYAGSNDGSEVLANAEPILRELPDVKKPVEAITTGKNFDN